jgi:phage-related protein
LQSLTLSDVAELVRQAIAAAFPDGVPSSDEEKNDLTEWTVEQEERLSALAGEFEEFNGKIINVLADFYRGSGKA